ncbi:MAG TPA: helix-turn-helix domain-containing protein [Cellvibrionaceae bacterium]|nr:helix-turn-helix domain-containing protein [Cellvibrionaceae bacterium]
MSKKNDRTPKRATTQKATQQKPAGSKKPTLQTTNRRAQQQRLLKTLIEKGSITTVEARQELNVMSPAPRILELRAQGHWIVTEYVTVVDQYGYVHRGVAKYVLIVQARRDL